MATLINNSTVLDTLCKVYSYSAAQEIPCFYRTFSFIMMLHHWTLPTASSIQSTSLHPILPSSKYKSHCANTLGQQKLGAETEENKSSIVTQQMLQIL
jgi:hypothetical protein